MGQQVLNMSGRVGGKQHAAQAQHVNQPPGLSVTRSASETDRQAGRQGAAPQRVRRAGGQHAARVNVSMSVSGLGAVGSSRCHAC
jgi:hypothetical protein